MRTDYQLGEWIVRPRRDCIERGGRVVHVKPKSMAVLDRLVTGAGEVVKRDEIFDAVWPGGAVTDDALTQCIVELRKALGDSARRPHYIETIPKVGFRLLQEVTPLNPGHEVEAAPGPNPVLRPASKDRPGAGWMILALAGVVFLGLILFGFLKQPGQRQATAPEPSVMSLAVLPFVDISEEQDQGWYAYGLTEELTNRLAQLDGLQVAARTSAYRFKDRNEDLREVGEALGVSYLLEGSVRSDEESLRITAQLIEARNGYHAWSKQFDRPRAAIFDVQQEISEAVATALSIRLQVGQLGASPGGTDNVEAYELLMLSKRYQWEATPDSVLLAIDCLKRALELDPDYARAWYRLAGMYVNTHSIRHNMDETDWMALAEEAAGRARELAPDMDDIRFMTMTIHYVNRNWSAVEKTMNRGVGLEHSADFDLLFGWVGFLNRVGRLRETTNHLERMRQLNPWSIGTANALARNYVNAGRTEEGFAEAERAFGLDGFKWDTVSNGINLALATNERDLLSTWLQRGEEFMPDSQEFIRAMRETLDDREAALAWLRNTFNETEAHDYLIPAWAVWHDDPVLALAAMQRLPAPAMFWRREMEGVRRLPGFRDLVRQVGLEEYFREYGWNDFCRPLGPEDFRCRQAD